MWISSNVSHLVLVAFLIRFIGSMTLLVLIRWNLATNLLGLAILMAHVLGLGWILLGGVAFGRLRTHQKLTFLFGVFSIIHYQPKIIDQKACLLPKLVPLKLWGSGNFFPHILSPFAIKVWSLSLIWLKFCTFDGFSLEVLASLLLWISVWMN